MERADRAAAGRRAFSALLVRDVSLLWRAILALTIGYSAFISEIFRAGIQSVDPGQIEAAKALGLSRGHRFRLIIFPQAIRTILPPLGNDFVAMVKDSSLVSVLGVADITQMGKIYAAGTFRFFETYSIVAYVYLILTIGLSLALRALEKRLRRSRRVAGGGPRCYRRSRVRSRLSTITFSSGAMAAARSFCSFSGTLNLASVSPKRMLERSQSSLVIPSPVCTVFMSRPV